MLLTANDTYGTIGGGYLEHESLQAARELLQDTTAPSARLRHLVLGRELGQCCGGVVDVWFERYMRADMPWLRLAAEMARTQPTALLISSIKGDTTDHRVVRAGRLDKTQSDFVSSGDRTRLNDEEMLELWERLDAPATPLWLYGAGHVGQALVRVLADLPFTVTWIDSRRELLPDLAPANVETIHTDSVVASVRDAPAHAHYLVMTHDHALDYALCKAILERNDFGFVGLIGSKSKSARFRSRLQRDGFTGERIARLTCPIGIGVIDSKLPAAIAVSVAAQLLEKVGNQQSAVEGQNVAPTLTLPRSAREGTGAHGSILSGAAKSASDCRPQTADRPSTASGRRPKTEDRGPHLCSSADCASCPSTQRSAR
jgi:xanthine dehydrogenase accessory factor